MAKTDRTVLISNDQEFGQVADPNKLEAQITHAFDKIDNNDNEFIAHQKQVDPTDTDNVRDKHVSNNDLKGLQDQITTNLNDLTIHKKQVDPTSSDTTRDKHVANNDLKTLQDQITTNNTASVNRDNAHKNAVVLDHPDQSVTTEKLKDSAVTSNKIANGAVSRNQLDPTLFEQTANASKFQEIDAQLADKTSYAVYVETYKKQTGDIDDTERIQRAIDALKAKGGGKLVFDNKEYKVTPKNLGALSFTEMGNFEVVGNEALIYNDPFLVSDTTPSLRLLYLIGCKNFKISGLKIKFQLDWNSSLSSGVVRNDQMLNVSSLDTRLSDNFNISGNTFEYYGPMLHNPTDGEKSRLSSILVSSDTPDPANPERKIKNFRIFGNHFKNCIGRTIYLLLAQNGSVVGNTFEELGKLIAPDNSYKQWAGAVGIRMLGCADLSVTGNTISGYSGEVLNYTDKGSILAIVAGKGVDNGKGENLTITGNTVNFNQCNGAGFYTDTIENINFNGNTIIGNELSSVITYGVRCGSGYKANNLSVNNNHFKHIKNNVVLESVNTDYQGISFEGNKFITGTNLLTTFESNADTKAYIGRNYFSDKGAFCEGVKRRKIVYANDVPPTTGTFTRGDVCYNSNWNYATSPVFAWEYQYNDGTKNVWRAVSFSIQKASGVPTIPTGAETAHTGILAIDTRDNTNGLLYFYNGSVWVKPDGTVRA